MTSRITVVAVFLAVLTPGLAGAFDLHGQVDLLVRDAMKANGAVGVVMGIYKDGETQVLGYGEVVKGGGKQPDGDTVYEVGSITKTFTGILLAEQVLAGQMKLEAPVQDYLPANVRLPSVPGGPVTVRQLVTHNGGFPHRPDNMQPYDPANPYAKYTDEALYTYLAAYKPAFKLGGYHYSNLGMGLAGHLVQRQTGQGYAELVAARITGPLGMKDTGPVPTPDMQQRLAPGYSGKLQRIKPWDAAPAFAGAVGIRSTVNDLLKYTRANLSPDDSPLGRAIALSHQKQGIRDQGKPIAIAWRMSANGQVLIHGGRTAGYRAWIAVMPSRQLGVVLLANGTAFKVVALGDKVFQTALRTLKGTATGATPMTEDPEPEGEEGEEGG
ncbi:MAG TPA: serine hydrolase domain-containing protein [bacterium]